eukprot:2449560-Amphidinium_carterae.1
MTVADAMEVVEEIEHIEKQRAKDLRGRTTPKPSTRRPRILMSMTKVSATELSSFIPKVPGSSIGFEQKWHCRIRGYYPTQAAPYSHSVMYTDGNDTELRTAALNVLRWMWTQHERLTKEACPYDLTEAASS